MLNIITIDDNEMILEGFSKLETYCTFCIYEKGIVITSKKMPPTEYHYNIKINNRKIENKHLLNQIKKKYKLIDNKLYFANIGDSYVQYK